jgi:hypothetical protein
MRSIILKLAIRNSVDKTPLAGATAVINNSISKTAIADSAGIVIFTNIVAGNYTVKISYVGFEERGSICNVYRN